jgi:type II secretory pathway pseudopilin PulG
LIICPSCGSKVDSDLCLGCVSCGARAIGPPLAKAEHHLPSYGRAAIASANGFAMVVGFPAMVIATLVQWGSFPRSFATVFSAGEVAAWRLKWVALPIAVALLWSGVRIVRSIKQGPDKFVGLRAARAGLVASLIVIATIATLIGVTVPERLRRHQWSVDAATYAQAYTIQRALQEYRSLHGTLPTNDDLVRELSSLPDPNGAIAEALRNIDASGYQASSVLAAASTKSKPMVQRGTALRNASYTANAEPQGVSFTNYDLRLPGPDKVLNTDDDFIVSDGLVKKLSDMPPPSSAPSKSSVP